MSFGNGCHYCLGSSLARLEAQVAIGSFVRRFPDLERRASPSGTAGSCRGARVTSREAGLAGAGDRCPRGGARLRGRCGARSTRSCGHDVRDSCRCRSGSNRCRQGTPACRRGNRLPRGISRRLPPVAARCSAPRRRGLSLGASTRRWAAPSASASRTRRVARDTRRGRGMRTRALTTPPEEGAHGAGCRDQRAQRHTLRESARRSRAMSSRRTFSYTKPHSWQRSMPRR